MAIRHEAFWVNATKARGADAGRPLKEDATRCPRKTAHLNTPACRRGGPIGTSQASMNSMVGLAREANRKGDTFLRF